MFFSWLIFNSVCRLLVCMYFLVGFCWSCHHAHQTDPWDCNAGSPPHRRRRTCMRRWSISTLMLPALWLNGCYPMWPNPYQSMFRRLDLQKVEPRIKFEGDGRLPAWSWSGFHNTDEGLSPGSTGLCTGRGHSPCAAGVLYWHQSWVMSCCKSS